MNITALLTRLRRSAFLAVSHLDYTSSVLTAEINDHMTQLFTRSVVHAQAGAWRMVEWYALRDGQRAYRLPPRAVMGTIGRVEVGYVDTAVDWWKLDEVTEADAARYENSPYPEPQRFVVRGDSIHLLPPAAADGEMVMRIFYSIRPSRINEAAQTAGLVTAIDTATRVVTVNSIPNSITESGVSTALTGTVAIDIVRAAGWYSVAWTGTGTVAGNTLTLAAHATGLDEANDLSAIAVGDYVRAAGQTDWPAIPEDFHRAVADAAASKVLTLRGMHEDASTLVQMHVTPDLQRFGDMLKPRVESGAFVVVAPEFR